MGQKKTIFLVDDDPAVRHALGVFLESAGFTVKEFTSATSFLETVNNSGNGVIVLDQRMRGMSGLELQSDLNKRGFEFPIIFITGHGDIQMSVKAIKAGATDFLEKPFSNQDLLQSIQEAFLRAESDQGNCMRKAEAIKRYESLTPREKEVIKYIAQGMSNKKLAEVLDISDRTIEVHRHRAMAKLGATSLPDLVHKIALCEKREPE
jgi:RNA polymerase sigma factor (sigma-70 family)